MFSKSWHSVSFKRDAEPYNKSVGTDVNFKLGSVLNGQLGFFQLEENKNLSFFSTMEIVHVKKEITYTSLGPTAAIIK